jgi:anti-sigma factor RsiW
MTPPTAPNSAPPDDPSLLVHAYLDGELDPAHALEVERRLATDPALAAERARVEALRALIAERLPREAPPPDLVRRIEAAVGARPAPARSAWRASHPSWQALAASVLLALFIGSGSTWFALRPGHQGVLRPSLTGDAGGTADFVVASHMRALMASQPIDVASSDRHTVKPWFNGRIPEAPRVIDLANAGFALVGGRIDVIGRVPVPTLVYRIRQHLISLTAVPASAAAPMTVGLRNIAGYNTLTWTDNGLTYWAVSDVAAADLETFAKAFREASP